MYMNCDKVRFSIYHNELNGSPLSSNQIQRHLVIPIHNIHTANPHFRLKRPLSLTDLHMTSYTGSRHKPKPCKSSCSESLKVLQLPSILLISRHLNGGGSDTKEGTRPMMCLLAKISDVASTCELMRASSMRRNVWSPLAPIHVAFRPYFAPMLGMGDGLAFQ